MASHLFGVAPDWPYFSKILETRDSLKKSHCQMFRLTPPIANLHSKCLIYERLVSTSGQGHQRSEAVVEQVIFRKCSLADSSSVMSNSLPSMNCSKSNHMHFNINQHKEFSGLSLSNSPKSGRQTQLAVDLAAVSLACGSKRPSGGEAPLFCLTRWKFNAQTGTIGLTQVNNEFCFVTQLQNTGRKRSKKQRPFPCGSKQEKTYHTADSCEAKAPRPTN